MHARTVMTSALIAALGLGTAGAVALTGPTAGADQHARPVHGLTVATVLSGASLSHTVTPVGAPAPLRPR